MIQIPKFRLDSLCFLLEHRLAVNGYARAIISIFKKPQKNTEDTKSI